MTQTRSGPHALWASTASYIFTSALNDDNDDGEQRRDAGSQRKEEGIFLSANY
jgi:hypothetical protein